MILVDSSVWIDYFRGKITPTTDALDNLLGRRLIATGDLIVAEVLQGFPNEREFRTAKELLLTLEPVELGGMDIAIQTARNYRLLRARGITVRKTIDAIIATRCILAGHDLLHSDRDFDAFEEHLGLRVLRAD